MPACTQTEQEIEALNLALRDRAAVGQWADFAVLLRQRDRLIEALPPASRRPAIEATLEANTAILTHARADREQTQERLASVRQKSSVSSYYRSNGGSTSA